MPTGLNRDLGLFSTMAIAIGAMVGSGIFILPGVAYVTVDGPAVVGAFLVAGILVLPAALSASEMATAMPEDGGSYVYVERGMGPLLGTIAGVGNWFMLSFKGALALIGGVPYLVFVAPELASYILPLAIALAVFFTIINVVSTSSTGKLQFAIVGLMILVMGYFIAGGVSNVGSERLTGAFDVGSGGFFVATALVFISYAGVIKIAAVAEEIKNPGTTIPRAMIGSLLITTALYVMIVYVAIGVVDVQAAIDGGQLESDGEGPIMALAAEATLGTIGVTAVVVAALLALASTANAGLLSASRFPFAMARDGLAPPQFETISARYNTPVLAISLSGAMIVLMITFLPIDQVAKFGSAFQIIVFILVNLAVVGFREGAVEEYDPVFVAPLYPWLQLFGMASGLAVLTQVGTVPFAGAVTIAAVSIVYYYLYARKRVDREGAARDAVRRNIGESALARTRESFESDAEYDVLVATTETTSVEAKRDMLRMATDLGRVRSTVVSVVDFLDVPHRVFSESHPAVIDREAPEWVPSDPENAPSWLPEHAIDPPTRTSGGVDLEPSETATTGTDSASSGTKTTGTDSAASEADTVSTDPETNIEYREIDSEDHKRAIVDFATYEGYDLIVLERAVAEFHSRLFGSDVEWILENAPCDVMLVEDCGFDGADEIAVVANRGAFDPLKLLIADAIAEETGAEINLLQAIPAAPPETQRRTIEDYHNELISICTVPARSTIVEADDEIRGLARFAESADLLVTGVDRTGISGRLLGRPGNRLVDSVDCTAVMVQTREGRKDGVLKRLVMDHLFG
ncbi:amino acid permease [Natronorubrum tibetense]|uniref:Amino acid permease-associated protein n=1 Tax=Natronorubrum tibetense GA33 TaxID=1114856 RepID=L9VM50_9EURY|nr:amino acid permease [Natronorubrum tibetense]ELY38234.1 amino acid permease-associated protein [Natronorubrum tibetense GA33]